MTVRRVHLYFKGHGARWKLGRRILLFIAGASAAWSFFAYFEAHTIFQSLEQSYRKATKRLEAGRAPVPSAAQARQLAEQVKAVNGLIRGLNQPWDLVFQTVRPPQPLAVTLFALDTGARADILRISAQAGHPGDMADYVSFLAENHRLRNAYLVKHESRREGGYQFEVEAEWKAEP